MAIDFTKDIYSQEQENVITAAIESDARIVSCDALPGSGKTTLMEGVGTKATDDRILYLVFNEHNAKEAAEKLPSNVTVQSFHKLAYRATLGDRPKNADGKKSEKNILMDDKEKENLFDEMVTDINKDNDVDIENFYPLNALNEAEELESDLEKMADIAYFESKERALSLISDPLSIYLENEFNISERRKEFTTSKIYDLGIENDYTKFAAEAYLSGVSANRYGNGETPKSKFYQNMVVLVEKNLEGGNLEIQAKYRRNSTPWKKATSALTDIMNVKLDLRARAYDRLEALCDRIVEKIANQMVDYQLDMSRETGIYHSTYLADYGNSNKPFQMGRQYDKVLLDEGQDTNPACWKVIQSMMYGNSNLKLIMVGDQHQSIYGFRQAKNVLNEAPINSIDATDPEQFKRFALTKVYRVGGEVADVANAIITLRHENLKNIADNKMRREGADEGLLVDKSMTNVPLYMCDAHDKERGKVVSWALNKPVLEAFKQSTQTKPAIICSKNLSNAQGENNTGVLGEIAKELRAGNAITLPKGGSAADLVKLIALMGRIKNRDYSDLSEDERARHDSAFRIAVKSMVKSVHEKPGYLLGRKYVENTTGQKSMTDEIGEIFNIKLEGGEGENGITEKNNNKMGITGLGLAIYERLILSYATNTLSENTLSASANFDAAIKAELTLKHGDDVDEKSYQYKGQENSLRKLSGDYAKAIGYVLMGESHRGLIRSGGIHNQSWSPNQNELDIPTLVKVAEDILKIEYQMDTKGVNEELKDWSLTMKELQYNNELRDAHVTHHPCAFMACTLTGVATKEYQLMLKDEHEINIPESATTNMPFLDYLALTAKAGDSLKITEVAQKIFLEEFDMDLDEANVLVGTVHKTKGLEYPYVGLSDDVLVPTIAGDGVANQTEAWNAALIAATRATHGMVLNKSIQSKVMTMAGQNPISSKLLGDTAELVLTHLKAVSSELYRGNSEADMHVAIDSDPNALSRIFKIKQHPDLEKEYRRDRIKFADDEDALNIKWSLKSIDLIARATSHTVLKLNGAEEGQTKAEQDLSKQMVIGHKSLSMLNTVTQETIQNAVAILSTDVIASENTKDFTAGLKKRMDDYDLKEMGRGLVETVEFEMKRMNYNPDNRLNSIAAIGAGLCGRGNTDFQQLCNGSISPSEYVDRRDLPSPITGLSANDKDEFYVDMAEKVSTMVSEFKQNPQLYTHGKTMHDFDLMKTVENKVVDHFAKTASNSIQALQKESNYVEAFSDQLVGTTQDPKSFYMLSDDERKEQQINENRLKQREVEKRKAQYENNNKDQNNGKTR